MEESAKDVTQRILDRHIIYGASDNTNPAYASSNRSLNYAEGGSIQRPQLDKVTIIPFKLGYSDTLGRFGKENHFVRVNVNVDPVVTFACFEEVDWECAFVDRVNFPTENTYIQAFIDIDKEVPTSKEDVVDQGYYYPEVTSGPPDYISDTYDPYTIGSGNDLDGNNSGYPYDQLDYEFANITGNKLFIKSDSYVSVDLTNLKTGNKYIDAWFDVRLYNKAREEHPYDKMYVRINDFFYIGFHARNTRRLPYNVDCVIGKEYVSGLKPEQERYKNV